MSSYMKGIITLHAAVQEFDLIGCWAMAEKLQRDLDALIAEGIQAKDPEVLEMFKGTAQVLLSGRVAAA